MVRCSFICFCPSFSSWICSVGITTWRTWGCCPSETTRCSRFCLTLFSWPEYVFTAYQRNISKRGASLENCVDEPGENGVQKTEVTASEQGEAEHDARQGGEGLSVRPLDPLQL